MIHQHVNYVSSWFVRVHGKARLEANGHSPWQALQRSCETPQQRWMRNYHVDGPLDQIVLLLNNLMQISND